MPGKLLQKSDDNRTASAHEVDNVTALRTARDFAHDRKLTLNAAKRKKKVSAVVHRDSKVTVNLWPKGGYKMRLDVGDDDVIETDWVAAVDVNPRPDIQVPLVDLLKPGRTRTHAQRGTLAFLLPHRDESDACSPTPPHSW